MIDTNLITIEGHRFDNKGSKVVLMLKARDQMKRPLQITLDAQLVDERAAYESLTGSPGAVHGILHGLAEVAWASGWRPRGLDGALIKALLEHKVTPKI